jgi:hypothetical protein
MLTLPTVLAGPPIKGALGGFLPRLNLVGVDLVALGQIGQLGHASLLRRRLQCDLRFQGGIDHWPRTRGELPSYRAALPSWLLIHLFRHSPSANEASVPARRCSRGKVSMPDRRRKIAPPDWPFAFADDPIRGVQAQSPVAIDAAGNGSRKRREYCLAATNAVAWPHSPAGTSGRIMLSPSKLML